MWPTNFLTNLRKFQNSFRCTGRQFLKRILIMELMFCSYLSAILTFYTIQYLIGRWTTNILSVRVARWLNGILYPIAPLRTYLTWKSYKSPLRCKRYLEIYLKILYAWPLLIALMAYAKGDIFHSPRWSYLSVILFVLFFVLWLWGILRVQYQMQRLDSPIMLQFRQHIDSIKETQRNNIHEDPSSKVAQPHVVLNNSDEIVFENVKQEELESHIISPLDIVIDDFPLADGMFGVVHKGVLVQNGSKYDIVIKTAKIAGNPANFSLMFEEIKIIIHAGDHSNIVKFFGVTSDGTFKIDNLGIINEWCENGSLDSFLENHTDCFELNKRKLFNCTEKEGKTDTYAVLVGSARSGSGIGFPVQIEDLYRFALEICLGMEHLASKKVIHGDLATRNILLTKNLTVKITDFGLSRRLYNYQMYSTVADTETLMPWRWMSIEALEDFKFSEKSDIWSYGVTLWEIFTLGEFPYDELDWSADIPLKIRDGLRLKKPMFVDKEMYELMQDCWQMDVNSRPRFKDLKSTLELIPKFGD